MTELMGLDEVGLPQNCGDENNSRRALRLSTQGDDNLSSINNINRKFS